jgi:hypothetical protein
MRAPWPATRPAFAIKQVGADPYDLAGPRLLFLGGQDPANPLVAGERRQIHPCRQSLRVGDEHGTQIFRDLMDDATRYGFSHGAQTLRNACSAERPLINGSTIGEHFAVRRAQMQRSADGWDALAAAAALEGHFVDVRVWGLGSSLR